jgi:chromosome segregation ATPase
MSDQFFAECQAVNYELAIGKLTAENARLAEEVDTLTELIAKSSRDLRKANAKVLEYSRTIDELTGRVIVRDEELREARALLERAGAILKKYQGRYHAAEHARKHWEEGAQVVAEIESTLEGTSNE